MRKIIPIIIILSLSLSACGIDLSDLFGSFTKSEYQYTLPEEPEETADNTITGYGFYYNQLSHDQQDLYRIMYDSASGHEGISYISFADKEDLYISAYALSYDHPEFFWVNGNFSVTTVNGYATEISFDIPDNAAQLSEELDSAANDIISQIPQNSSEYDIVKLIYDWIIKNCDYQQGEQDQDIRSVLIDKNSVCAGYSRAFEYLCNKADIPCTFISGEVSDGGSHAWNLVYLSKNYYWIDVTWGDPLYAFDTDFIKPNYDFFLVADHDMFVSHVLHNSVYMDGYELENDTFTFPVCSSDNYNYHMLNGSYFYKYDREISDSYILSRLDSDDDTIIIDMKFSSSEAWNDAYEDIIPKDSTSHAGTIISNYYSGHSLFNFFTYSLSYTASENSLSYRIKIVKT